MLTLWCCSGMAWGGPKGLKTAAPLSMASTVPESDIIVDQVSLVRCGGLGRTCQGDPVVPICWLDNVSYCDVSMCVDWKWDRVSEYREVFTIACPDFDWLSSGFSSLLAPMICECAMRFPTFLVSVLHSSVLKKNKSTMSVCRVLFSHVEWYNTQKEDEFNLFELLFTVISYAAAPPRWNTVALLNYCMHSRYYQWTYVQPVTFFGHLSCRSWL